MRLSKLPLLAYRYWRADRKLDPPLQVGLAVNNTCNTFCEMCNIWKQKPKEALSVDEIRRIFSNPLFRRVGTVSITGGEPTMRKDLAEIPEALSEVLPSLTRIALTSNGYATEKIVSQFEHFLPVLSRRRIDFTVNLSMDGVGDMHNKIRGNKRAFGHLEDTISRLIALRSTRPFNLVLACTLTKTNASDAENVLNYARSRGIYVIFRNAFSISRIDNLLEFPTFVPTPDQLEELREFYESTLGEYDKSHTRSLYYKMLLRMLDGGERDIPCLYRKAGLFIDHRADMFVCTVFSRKLGNALRDDPERVYFGSKGHRDELSGDACRGCSHDVTLYVPVRNQAWDRLKSSVTKIRR